MELSDNEFIIKLNKEFKEVKLFKNDNEIIIKNFKENSPDIIVEIDKFLNFIKILSSKPKETLSKEEIVYIIKLQLNEIADKNKNKSEKEKIAIDIFTFLFQFKDVMFLNSNFKNTVFLKMKELFFDFKHDENYKLINLYLSLFHINSIRIKKVQNKKFQYTYKISEKKINNIYEESIDYYLDNI